MKTRDRSKILGRSAWAVLFVGGMCLVLFGHAIAGPVVQSTDETATEDESTDTSDVPFPLQNPAQPAPTPSAPSSSSTGGQPTTAYQPNPQSMPLPPTYAPGSPGAQAGSTMDPYGAMPLPPTAYGPYDSSGTGAPSPEQGMVRPGVGPNMGGSTGGMAPQTGGATGYGVPPSPTPTISLGGAAMADPSYGRYEAMNIREATAPRQPATFGLSRSQTLRGSKPFSQSRQQSAYSPYMRLNNPRNWSEGSNAYYQYVKPMLDQQQENSVVNRDIQGLTDTARAGYQSMESMKQRPGNTIRQAAPRTPATFMNTGQYYPGFGR
ncbi:MAG: hypothetical protein JW888_12770 [Pirellulales bacterium]|nr:hypothetical protein [Pirellulales bacterium]